MRAKSEIREKLESYLKRAKEAKEEKEANVDAEIRRILRFAIFVNRRRRMKKLVSRPKMTPRSTVRPRRTSR